ncbi:MAG TPA: manganese efflux pump MntP family protein [Sedimentisphaerales bacterium]|nr:manganese efflux pump MntP family protein [Sedimentisphaerales bacterium]
MDLVTIILIAVGLAMDAFAVSIVSGSVYQQLHIRHALRMAVFFGGFQAFMPLIGSLAGMSVKDYIADYDHWVAFGLLAAVGGKMIYESFKIKSAEKNLDPSNVLVLLVLALATSIDALAIGITLSLIVSSITVAVIIIGLVTFVLSYLGVFIGKKFGHFFENKIEALGGLILVGLGVKIVLGHTVF